MKGVMDVCAIIRLVEMLYGEEQNLWGEQNNMSILACSLWLARVLACVRSNFSVKTFEHAIPSAQSFKCVNPLKSRGWFGLNNITSRQKYSFVLSIKEAIGLNRCLVVSSEGKSSSVLCSLAIGRSNTMSDWKHRTPCTFKGQDGQWLGCLGLTPDILSLPVLVQCIAV